METLDYKSWDIGSILRESLYLSRLQTKLQVQDVCGYPSTFSMTPGLRHSFREKGVISESWGLIDLTYGENLRICGFPHDKLAKTRDGKRLNSLGTAWDPGSHNATCPWKARVGSFSDEDLFGLLTNAWDRSHISSEKREWCSWDTWALLEFATNTYMYLSPIAFLVLATVILGHICFTCAMLAPFSFSEDWQQIFDTARLGQAAKLLLACLPCGDAEISLPKFCQNSIMTRDSGSLPFSRT